MGLLRFEITMLLLVAFLIGFALVWLFLRRMWTFAPIPSIVGVVLCIFCLPLLCWHCVDNHTWMISTDIRHAVESRVNPDQTNGIAVAADGRDITLTGKVATDSAKSEVGDEAKSVAGVRTVTNDLSVGGDASSINAQIGTILSTQKIEFENGNDVLLASSTPVLEQVLAVLKKASGLSIQVNGYTDDSGNAISNRALSEHRAQAVAGWFERNGIEASRIQAAGFGSEHPIAPNTTVEGKAKNRRVEITTDTHTN